ncbi:hypothetical protein L6164_036635 [Bauhinia variegata]|uniref:Uncharacterized protein n=1 Tax=Bauhinia variegata TaxID=167791 RepID=A0ACB9KHJ7_BAUVA|nr:hypothetical protein L6164_036635 [Bauhinia variegata]
MEQIQHKFIEVEGLKLHVAETGTGPNVVVFLHGFPEIWYCWRHQMIALANAGFRAIAPDYRGYGLSDPPPQPENATFSDLVSDLRSILDSLGLAKLGFSGCKRFWNSARISICTSTPREGLGSSHFGSAILPARPSSVYHKHLPEGFYILRWQEPGRAEADFGRLDAKTVVRNIYILFSRSEIPIAPENKEIMDLVEPSTPLPPWFTEEDLAAYGALYEKSGFQTALKVPYRSIDEVFNIPDPITKVPAFLIMGGKDYFLKFPEIEDLIKSGKAKEFAPNLEITFIPEGTHFVQEQFPEQVNQLILDFLGKHI